jgi:hypothetical protein
MQPKQDRRFDRVQVSLEASFGILVPEATFQPALFKAIVSDLSERGAMVRVELDQDTYRHMLQRTRFCRLTFDQDGLPGKLIGKAVWIQPQDKSADGRIYKIGLFFEDCPTHVCEQLRHFVNTLIKPAIL